MYTSDPDEDFDVCELFSNDSDDESASDDE